MWQMIAEPGLRCAECRHNIQPGRLCLSELPEETPAGVSRSDFKNYCIGCPECWRQGKHACYVRHLDSGRSIGQTPRSLPCARCGRRIGTGEKAGVDIYYEWPEAIAETASNRSVTATLGTATTAAGVDTLIRGVRPILFNSLSDSLQDKFRNAGLGGERGVRTLAEAQHFYHDSLPYPVRILGEPTISQYLDGKHASHIQSVRNAPHLAASNDNIIWENAHDNLVRGAEDMTGWEQLSAKTHNAYDTVQIVRQQGDTNAFDASNIVFRDCLSSAATTALYAGLLEAPVAAIENYIHYQKGRKTGEEAIKDAAVSIAKRAATGAVVGFAVTGAVTLLGAGPLLITIAPILVGVGFALYSYSFLKRILNALADGLPLNQVGTYFCSPRCHTLFAYETGQSALMRWEANRVAATT